MTDTPRRRAIARAAGVAIVLVLAAGCGPRLDVGSDLLWTGLFEGNTFDEWMGDSAGAALAFPAPPNLIEVSNERVRHGGYAARLTIDAPPGGSRGSAVLARSGDLPAQGYYSAWYYLPRSIAVGNYWVIFKFRHQDQSTMDELYDMDLVNLDSGEMSLQLYDHRRPGVVPLDVTNPIVPVGQWFQIEAFYFNSRNAADATGRLTFWLDGRQIVDIADPTSTPLIEWNACSIGENLTPSTAVLYVDDCAVSRSRVGPTGIIAD